jgi:iron-sulfur cluster repair protein YtfE (RIC family)
MTADTRIMGIVHDALRRDLRRAMQAVSTMPYPAERQRIALGDHLAWMMDFLHAHHTGEDQGLWPQVAERRAGATSVVDAMRADHARVAPLIDVCRSTAHAYSAEAGDDTRVALCAALQDLSDVLLPHLQREEEEMLPIAGAALTDAEWRALDHEYFIEAKSFTELGFEGQ